MAEIGKLVRVDTGEIHIVSVSGGSVGVITADQRPIEWRGAEYAGPYQVTPGSEAQRLTTHDLRMTEDLIIDPIPSQYGLVTWNGSVLTVS